MVWGGPPRTQRTQAVPPLAARARQTPGTVGGGGGRVAAGHREPHPCHLQEVQGRARPPRVLLPWALQAALPPDEHAGLRAAPEQAQPPAQRRRGRRGVCVQQVLLRQGQAAPGGQGGPRRTPGRAGVGAVPAVLTAATGGGRPGRGRGAGAGRRQGAARQAGAPSAVAAPLGDSSPDLGAPGAPGRPAAGQLVRLRQGAAVSLAGRGQGRPRALPEVHGAARAQARREGEGRARGCRAPEGPPSTQGLPGAPVS